MILFGSEQFEVFLFGYFYVDAETVGIQPGFIHQFPARSGNAFQMDISVEAVHLTQIFRHAYQPFHCIVGTTDHTGTEKQAFDIVSPVKFNCQFHQFGHRQGGAGKIIAAPVDAVGTVVNTIIGQHDFEQGDAPSVFGKTVADSPSSYGIAQHARFVGAHCTAGCTGYIVLGGFCQNL